MNNSFTINDWCGTQNPKGKWDLYNNTTGKNLTSIADTRSQAIRLAIFFIICYNENALDIVSTLSA